MHLPPVTTMVTVIKMSQKVDSCGVKITDLVVIICIINLPNSIGKGKAVPLHAMEALGGRGGIAPTHSRPRH
jgi:hypothetical protein